MEIQVQEQEDYRSEGRCDVQIREKTRMTLMSWPEQLEEWNCYLLKLGRQEGADLGRGQRSKSSTEKH